MEGTQNGREVAPVGREGETDKGGHPYILHPLRVMLALRVLRRAMDNLTHEMEERPSSELCYAT